MMSERIFNFSAGPATLPVEVLERAKDEMLSLPGIGMSVMEISHRSKTFEAIMESARSNVRELMNLPDDRHVLFLQGGATLQFSMVPINFLSKDRSADYVITGSWGKKAIKEAKREGGANKVYSSEENNLKSIPQSHELRLNPDAAYIHYTSNETIEGVEFKYDLDGGDVPVVCDMSSNIMSKPIDVTKYDLIYAGAQKNLGPAGVTLVIISDELLAKQKENQHQMLDYRAHVENKSLLNTPNTFGVYILDLVCQWLKDKGGLQAVQQENEAKAKLLYDALETSDGYYRPHADREARSTMNATFRLPSEELEKQFTKEASAIGLDGLQGHRSVGGIRASMYNAFPRQGVERLVEFMREFQEKNG